MQSTRTQRCAEHEHPEFLLRYEKLGVGTNDIDWLRSYLERRIAMGLKVDPGDLLTIGWLGLRVLELEDGLLGLEEPDMSSYPVSWQESVTHSLQHLRLHTDVVQSLFGPYDAKFPSMLESATICSRLKGSCTFVAKRDKPESSTQSGWFFACTQDDHDHDELAELESVTLYEAMVAHNSRPLPYLALPFGVSVIAMGLQIAAFMDGKPVAIRRRSFLDLSLRGMA